MEAVVRHCATRPGAVEEEPWGHPVYKVGGKLFAGIGEETVTVKASLEKQAVLVLDPAVRVADYVGRFGWVTIDVTRSTLKMAISLIDESYDAVCSGLPKRVRERIAKPQ